MVHEEEELTVELHRHPTVEESHRNTASSGAEMRQRLFQEGEQFEFRRNGFPYHLEDGVSHFILWIAPGVWLPASRAGSIIDRFLEEHGYDLGSQRVFYKNSIAIKSIREIDHIHVFVKNYRPVAE